MKNKTDKVISMKGFEGHMKDESPVGQQLEAFRETVAYVKASLELQIEHNEYFAVIIRAKYQALVEVGFSEQQALLLCK